jgi:hypothetical protein
VWLGATLDLCHTAARSHDKALHRCVMLAHRGVYPKLLAVCPSRCVAHLTQAQRHQQERQGKPIASTHVPCCYCTCSRTSLRPSATSSGRARCSTKRWLPKLAKPTCCTAATVTTTTTTTSTKPQQQSRREGKRRQPKLAQPPSGHAGKEHRNNKGAMCPNQRQPRWYCGRRWHRPDAAGADACGAAGRQPTCSASSPSQHTAGTTSRLPTRLHRVLPTLHYVCYEGPRGPTQPAASPGSGGAIQLVVVLQ